MQFQAGRHLSTPPLLYFDSSPIATRTSPTTRSRNTATSAAGSADAASRPPRNCTAARGSGRDRGDARSPSPLSPASFFSLLLLPLPFRRRFLLLLPLLLPLRRLVPSPPRLRLSSLVAHRQHHHPPFSPSCPPPLFPPPDPQRQPAFAALLHCLVALAIAIPHPVTIAGFACQCNPWVERERSRRHPRFVPDFGINLLGPPRCPASPRPCPLGDLSRPVVSSATSYCERFPVLVPEGGPRRPISCLSGPRTRPESRPHLEPIVIIINNNISSSLSISIVPF